MSNKTSGAFASRIDIARDFGRFKHQPPTGMVQAITRMTGSEADERQQDNMHIKAEIQATLGDDRVAWAKLRREHVEDDLPGSSTTTSELRRLMERGRF